MDALDADVMVNVHKGQQGYGIYFTLKEPDIIVTAIDQGSEAQKAGVQPKDLLISVMDHDKKYPEDNPGAVIRIDKDNYHSALDLVRKMKYVQLAFRSPPCAAFG
jgi:predicted metalloprotease with PDZ domain